MLGTAKQADENVFGRNVLVNADTNDQSGQQETVEYLEQSTSGVESRNRESNAAIRVHDHGEDHVHNAHEIACSKDCFTIFPWLPHIRNDGQEHGRATRTDEQVC